MGRKRKPTGKEQANRGIALLATALSGLASPSGEALEAAERLVLRAKRLTGSSLELAGFAAGVLRLATSIRGRKDLPAAHLARAVSIALGLAGRPKSAARDAALGLSELVATGRVAQDEGRLRLTDARPDWEVADLPGALRDLAGTLELLGGVAGAKALRVQTGLHPSDVVGKYPLWRPWIRKHVRKIQRGVYELL